MAGGSVSSSTTGSTMTPIIHVSREPRGSGSRTRAEARRPSARGGREHGAERHEPRGAARQVQRRAPGGHQEPEQAGPRAEGEPGRDAGRADAQAVVVASLAHPQITWIHRVATRVVAPTAITTVRTNPF